jgi:hypothetical protein
MENLFIGELFQFFSIVFLNFIINLCKILTWTSKSIFEKGGWKKSSALKNSHMNWNAHLLKFLLNHKKLFEKRKKVRSNTVKLRYYITVLLIFWKERKEEKEKLQRKGFKKMMDFKMIDFWISNHIKSINKARIAKNCQKKWNKILSIETLVWREKIKTI